MRKSVLVVVLAGALSVVARGQMEMIEGQVVYVPLEGGCWVLEDMWSGMSFELYGGGPDLYEPGVWATIWGFSRPEWVTVCMMETPFEVIEYQVGGFDPWWWPPSMSAVTPAEPTSADPLTVAVSGEWPDSCIPNASDIVVVGAEVFLDVILDYPPGTDCLAMITPWWVSEDLDPLPPGSYTVYATLWGDPFVPEVPISILTFTVTAATEPMDPDVAVPSKVKGVEQEHQSVARLP